MKGKYNHVLCFIAAMVILFSGMCVEPADADSFLACADDLSSTSFLSSQKGLVSRYELSTREMSGTHEAAFITSSIKRPAVRNIIRQSLILLLAEALPAKLSNLRIAVETIYASETHYVAALLNYIHRQDGKK